ncbi:MULTISPECIES: (2Fe-2S)-binding protein [Romboutsia]|uniref:Bacterioferritin-associated ferredoxin n=1 Tax=Romboutsia hominis TaxID=1507512 RepID=A0A2P2BP88_9FIRM|nr:MULTISPECIES: (2Fe-2S)-binding protein [Romboutsia]MCH1970081.1 (2Fe-2S)-binding protein [Romboutsia hominis]MDB8790296.1 (2Fe-2S)-binding protein [Romboutsia sp. 1001216sp1]MDB8792270.1 (2Fe-2S)-binding protein [Romboutsia sp. 1001216sp1]MDB8795565.1 (2Fe-2S)-binding protein [Romboutsia sp. 1001216sp1]MDB8798556.1 (2Fe-2S)-binding protein [Romboutsia sp. 1001216sp1]
MLKNIIKKYKENKDNKNKVVCSCFEVTKADIQNAVNEGITSINEVRKKTKAGMGCGRCNASIERVVYKAIKSKNESKDKSN